ncbi:hypothetical protein IAG44_12400 [Streptomyces roseirectus]|uniref:Uncharacterized protein n=1 Tax=Streptomyces roseirectus TaxID=2768066 RepID=A0A7H0IBK5_9ACTN|nr:hypothetical protein [Streptomyces roseirectus]QNP70171.1 hypothetical protein IAG44_12400 [Streptomyces roseirectus]
MKRRTGTKRTGLKPSATQLAAFGATTSAALLAVLGPVTVTVDLSAHAPAQRHPAAQEQQTPVNPICPLTI